MQLPPSIHQRLLHQLYPKHVDERTNNHDRNETHDSRSSQEHATRRERKHYTRDATVSTAVDEQQTVGVHEVVLSTSEYLTLALKRRERIPVHCP